MKTSFEPHDGNCPICHEPCVSLCRCDRFEAKCSNGHSWHEFKNIKARRRETHVGIIAHTSNDHSNCTIVHSYNPYALKSVPGEVMRASPHWHIRKPKSEVDCHCQVSSAEKDGTKTYRVALFALDESRKQFSLGMSEKEARHLHEMLGNALGLE